MSGGLEHVGHQSEIRGWVFRELTKRIHEVPSCAEFTEGEVRVSEARDRRHLQDVSGPRPARAQKRSHPRLV